MLGISSLDAWVMFIGNAVTLMSLTLLAQDIHIFIHVLIWKYNSILPLFSLYRQKLGSN